MKIHYELIEDLDFWIANNSSSLPSNNFNPENVIARIEYFNKMRSYLINRKIDNGQ